MKNVRLVGLVLGLGIALTVTVWQSGGASTEHLWCSTDARLVFGGDCYALSNSQLCEGGSVGCGALPCLPGIGGCPVSSIKVMQNTASYFTSSTSVENGGTTTTHQGSVLCFIEEKCDTNCIPSTGAKDYCGMSSSNSDKGKKDCTEPGKTGC